MQPRDRKSSAEGKEQHSQYAGGQGAQQGSGDRQPGQQGAFQENRSTQSGSATGRGETQPGQRGRQGLARRDMDFGMPSLFGGGGPFTFMRRLSEAMDRMFEDFGGESRGLPRSFSRGGLQSLWSPQVEIYERDGKLHISADLPGLRREDVQVDIDDDSLTIRGERRQKFEDEQQGFYRSERSYGSFHRTIPLPEGVNAESAEASFRDGVLEITMDAPKGTRRGRSLEIREGSGGETGVGSARTGGQGDTPRA
jgi:HSP20 family protein